MAKAEGKTEVKRIVIQVKDKEIPLTVDEAKELRKILDDLFGERDVVYIPSPYPVTPLWPYRYWGWNTYTDNKTEGITVTYSCNSQ